MITAELRSSSLLAAASACAAFKPWFFQALMAHCHWRAVALSVAPPQSFMILVTSSVSKIENCSLSPI